MYLALTAIVLFFLPGVLAGVLAGGRGAAAVLWPPLVVLVGRKADDNQEWTISGLEDEFVGWVIVLGVVLTLLGVVAGAAVRRRGREV